MSTTRRSDAADEITPLSMAVIDAIADREGVDPVDLEPPLYDVIDLDALDSLVRGPAQSTIEITFQYGEYDVRVTNHGDIDVSPIGE